MRVKSSLDRSLARSADGRQACQHKLPSGKRCAARCPAYYMHNVSVRTWNRRQKRWIVRRQTWCADCAINDPPADPTRLMNPEQLKEFRDQQRAEKDGAVPRVQAIRGPQGFGPSPLATFVDAMFTMPSALAVRRLQGEQHSSDRELHINRLSVRPLCERCGIGTRLQGERFCKTCRVAARTDMRNDVGFYSRHRVA